MNRKNMANRVLAGVFLLFVVASMLKYFYKDLLLVQLFSFVTEAAVVGGVADWFAVTALFKKPLGFPWHTALITRHRGRVISAMADMIEYELLSIQSIKERVSKISVVNLIIDWVENKEGKPLLKSWISKQSGNLLASIDGEALAIHLDDILKSKIRETQLTPHIIVAAQWAVKHNKYEQVVSYILDECLSIVKKNETRQLIYSQLLKIRNEQTKSIFEKAIFWLAEQTDSVNLAEASEAVYEELLVILYEAKHRDHKLYKWLHVKLLHMINQLESQDSWSEAVEEWKDTVTKEMDVTPLVSDFIKIALEGVQDSTHSPILTWLYEELDIYWDNFVHNQQAQTWLEAGIKRAVYQLIENEHHLLGMIVKNVLNTFSDDDLNHFIEDKAGDDLQWIRINGCVVGGVVGLVLFSFLHFVYDPLVIPVVQGLLR